MFEKQRKALNDNAQYQRVKTHVQANKNVYIGTAGGFVIGAVICSRNPEIKQTVDAFKFQYKSPTTNMVTATLVRRGHPGFETLNQRTGERAASLRRMAEIDGVSRAFIKANMKGDNPIYKNLGEM